MTAKRIEDVELAREADEILVMRTGGDWEAHALNQSAAAVYDMCDGRASRNEMAAEVSRRTGLPADEEIVDVALAELADAGLVVLEASVTAGVSRRAVIRRLGLTSAAVALLPVVETILVPPASAQYSSPAPGFLPPPMGGLPPPMGGLPPPMGGLPPPVGSPGLTPGLPPPGASPL